MEILNAYIRDLLFLHDCVILPDFGGFVANYEAAKKTENDYFTPPRKVIAFNPQLKHNDGLLANTIVAIEKISYEEAIQRIQHFVVEIKKNLKATGSYQIPAVGKLQKGNEDRILFVPNATTNFLVDTLGMKTFHMMPFTKQIAITPEPVANKPIIAMPVLRRILVASVSGFALLSLILSPGKFENLTLSSIAPTNLQEQKAVAIVNGSPATSKNQGTSTNKAEKDTYSKEFKEVVPTEKRYHVMVGCFAMKENANYQKEQLITENIEAKVFSYSNSLTGVAAGSFATFEEARVLMHKLRNTGKAPSAWVLKRIIK